MKLLDILQGDNFDMLCEEAIFDDETYTVEEISDALNAQALSRSKLLEMLSDEQKEDLECGLITMDDIRRDMGGSVYGERIQEYQYLKVGRGYSSGRKDTAYTADDMVIKSITEEVTEDLFDDDDEI